MFVRAKAKETRKRSLFFFFGTNYLLDPKLRAKINSQTELDAAVVVEGSALGGVAIIYYVVYLITIRKFSYYKIINLIFSDFEFFNCNY